MAESFSRHLSLVSTGRISGAGNNRQVCDVADAGQGFAAEAKGANRLQIFKRAQLAGGEPLAYNLKVVALYEGGRSG